MAGKKGSVLFVDYKKIEKATENFLEGNILGEGGFGCVYKARLDDNLDVAVKELHCESHIAEREFEVLPLLIIHFGENIFFSPWICLKITI